MLRVTLLWALLSVAGFAQTAKFADGTDTSKEFHQVQVYAPTEPSEQVVVGKTIPENVSIVEMFQSNTAAVYTRSMSTTVNAVGTYIQSVCANGGACWGANTVVESEKGRGAILFSQEINVNTRNKDDVAIGQYFGGNSSESPDASFVQVIAPLGQFGATKKHWRYGTVYDADSVDIPLVIYPTSGMDRPTDNSAPIILYARKNGKYVAVKIFATPDGQLNVNGRLY